MQNTQCSRFLIYCLYGLSILITLVDKQEVVNLEKMASVAIHIAARHIHRLVYGQLRAVCCPADRLVELGTRRGAAPGPGSALGDLSTPVPHSIIWCRFWAPPRRQAPSAAAAAVTGLYTWHRRGPQSAYKTSDKIPGRARRFAYLLLGTASGDSSWYSLCTETVSESAYRCVRGGTRPRVAARRWRLASVQSSPPAPGAMMADPPPPPPPPPLLLEW